MCVVASCRAANLCDSSSHVRRCTAGALHCERSTDGVGGAAEQLRWRRYTRMLPSVALAAKARLWPVKPSEHNE
eukprot:6193550-Pleurochrysis_carterae.AAC.3